MSKHKTITGKSDKKVPRRFPIPERPVIDGGMIWEWKSTTDPTSDLHECQDPFDFNLDHNLGDLEDETVYPPIISDRDLANLNKLYAVTPVLNGTDRYYQGEGITTGYNKNEPWIQTFSGRRFNPIKPNYKAIVIQDIAQALSNICRFTGHSCFYSVAQHSVLVSYICRPENALYGLLHDATEAYCCDLASPIKREVELAEYRKLERRLQDAICQRFGLPEIEPDDVKQADMQLLATEARDLMSPLHSDWRLNIKPLPFTIVPLPPKEAKQLFLERFTELVVKI